MEAYRLRAWAHQCSAAEEEVKWFHDQMKDAYEVKIRGVLGADPGDDKRIEILNRIVEWKADGISYEGA